MQANQTQMEKTFKNQWILNETFLLLTISNSIHPNEYRITPLMDDIQWKIQSEVGKVERNCVWTRWNYNSALSAAKFGVAKQLR